MPDQTRIGRPGPRDRTFVPEHGDVLQVPNGWALLPPGDAGLTRRVKAAGPTWSMSERRGRKAFSRGVWAPSATIEAARGALEQERLTPEHGRKLERSRARREQEQRAYTLEFEAAVHAFLRFAPAHADLQARLARAVTEHAVPVGSGTVARTQRIPVERRAEAAVIAWMRHHTTAYDDMQIARIKGRRREVRRLLAERSRKLLERYRRHDPTGSDCPLLEALGRVASGGTAPAPTPQLAPAPATGSRGGWARDP